MDGLKPIHDVKLLNLNTPLRMLSFLWAGVRYHDSTLSHLLQSDQVGTNKAQCLLTCGHLLASWCDPLHSCFSLKEKREGGAPSFSLPSPTLSPFPPAPYHLFRSSNFHLKHVELILPLHRFLFFPSFWETSSTQLQSDRKIQQQNILS